MYVCMIWSVLVVNSCVTIDCKLCMCDCSDYFFHLVQRSHSAGVIQQMVQSHSHPPAPLTPHPPQPMTPLPPPLTPQHSHGPMTPGSSHMMSSHMMSPHTPSPMTPGPHSVMSPGPHGVMSPGPMTPHQPMTPHSHMPPTPQGMGHSVSIKHVISDPCTPNYLV